MPDAMTRSNATPQGFSLTYVFTYVLTGKFGGQRRTGGDHREQKSGAMALDLRANF
jgi:hypothetical protein